MTIHFTNKIFKLSFGLWFSALPLATSWGEGFSCDVLLKPRRGTLESLIEKTRADSRRLGPLTPEYNNPQTEIALAAKWQGVRGPRMLQSLLPEDCTFIDHKLLGSAGDGIVKDAGSGEFIMIRCFMEWNGERVGFNISAPKSTLVQNYNREKKWLVGPEAEVLLDWGHGGGTKTTGNHTTIGIMNYLAKFGGAVIGMDQPWHAEGPREFFKDDLDYFNFRVALLEKFVHPSVDAIGVGHSMGGIFADMMMRRSDNPKARLSRYKGFIALAAVVDLAPGKTLAEKHRAERAHEEALSKPPLYLRQSPDDRVMGGTLVADNKIAITPSLFERYMNVFHDWTPPAHLGSEYLPTLYIWGDSDWLYVGNEGRINSNLKILRNVSLRVYGIRVNFAGEVVQVGHLLFDHHRLVANHEVAKQIVEDFLTQQGVEIKNEHSAREEFFVRFVKPYVSEHFLSNPGNNGFTGLYLAAYYWDKDFQNFAKAAMRENSVYKEAWAKAKLEKFKERDAERAFHKQMVMKETPETFTLVREYMEAKLGKELKHIQRTPVELVVLMNLLQAYSSNLAFRHYLQSATVQVENSTAALQELNKTGELLRDYARLADRARKTTNEIDKLKRAGKPVEAQEEILQKANESLLQLAEALKAKGIEDSVDARLVASEKVKRVYQKAEIPQGQHAEEARKNIAMRERLRAETKSFREEKDKKRDQVERLSAERTRLETQIKDFARASKNPQVVAIYKGADQALELLKKADQDVRDGIEQYLVMLTTRGMFTKNWIYNLPPELQAKFDHYERMSKVYQTEVARISEAIAKAAREGIIDLEAQQAVLRLDQVKVEHSLRARELNVLEGKIWAKLRLQEQLLLRYTNVLVPGYYQIEYVKLSDILEQGLEAWNNPTTRGLLEAAWGEWKTIWKERPPPEKVELY